MRMHNIIRGRLFLESDYEIYFHFNGSLKMMKNWLVYSSDLRWFFRSLLKLSLSSVLLIYNGKASLLKYCTHSSFTL
jgi:hypothetical protein